MSDEPKPHEAIEKGEDGVYRVAAVYRSFEQDGARWAEIEYRNAEDANDPNRLLRQVQEPVPKELNPAERYAWISGYRVRLAELMTDPSS